MNPFDRSPHTHELPPFLQKKIGSVGYLRIKSYELGPRDKGANKTFMNVSHLIFVSPHAWLEEFRIMFNYDNQAISLATYAFLSLMATRSVSTINPMLVILLKWITA